MRVKEGEESKRGKRGEGWKGKREGKWKGRKREERRETNNQFFWRGEGQVEKGKKEGDWKGKKRDRERETNKNSGKMKETKTTETKNKKKVNSFDSK